MYADWVGRNSVRYAPALCLAACILGLTFAAPARAQSTAGADTLIGSVTGPGGQGIPAATVRVTDDDGRTLTTRTDREGTYRLVVRGDGRYLVTASGGGYAPATQLATRAGTAGRIERDLALAPVQLDPLRAQGRRGRVQPAGQRRTPGQRGESWEAFLTEGMPVEPGDLAGLAALTPGVTRLGDSETGAGGLSIAGQAPEQNNTTVDGASFGGGSLPAEAVQRTSVVTSTYDVARGQFSGGQVAATTRSGSNLWAGALSTRLHDPALRYGDLPGSGGAQAGRLLRLDGGGGGPLLPDRLFVYGAAQAARRTRPASFLDPADAAGLLRLGVVADSAHRFLEISRRLGLGEGVATPDNAVSDNVSALARLDYVASERHTWTMRLDGRWLRSVGIGGSPLALSGGAGEQRSANGGALVQLTSLFSGAANELRVYAAGGEQRATPERELPLASVQVASTLPHDALGLATLRFGGNSLLATNATHRSLELADELTTRSADGAHQIKLGLQLQAQRSASKSTTNALGTFEFASLAELEAGRPTLFTRTLGADAQSAEQHYLAAYLGDVWDAGSRLRLTYGLRVEGYHFPTRPVADSGVVARFGGAGDVPGTWGVSPRFGFSFEPSRRTSLHGGIGEFRGKFPLQGLAAALAQTGSGARWLQCLGPAAPAPDWAGYATDPARIPATCADGPARFADQSPRLTRFAPDFAPPRTWRASLGGGAQLPNSWSVSADASVAYGLDQPSATERNLDLSGGFRLASEAGRPVFAPARDIDPRTGSLAPGAARLEPSLGAVRELDSRGRSAAAQVSLGVYGLTRRLDAFSAYYTYTHARDEAGGVPTLGGPSASTAANPNQRQWAAGDYEQRHLLQAMFTRRLTPKVKLTALGSLASGRPFTPLVSADINGDGYANDRAFLFDPEHTADAEVADGMRHLLANAPEAVRACLRAELGRIASRNRCHTPWTPTLDLQLSAQPFAPRRRLQLFATASNLSAGLDYFFHGPSGLRGWGQLPFTDPVLLNVRGYDAASGAYRYQVNPRFGELFGARGVLRTPFTLTLQARITLGADPAYQRFAQTVNTAMQNARSPERIRPLIEARLVNAPLTVISLNGARRIDLTPTQFEHLRQSADSLQRQLVPMVDSLVAIAGSGSAAFSPARQARIEELSRASQALVDAGLKATREVLTPAQWARLPGTLTDPPREEPIVPAPRLTIPAEP